MRMLNNNENQTSEISNDSLMKLLVGLRKIKELANQSEDRNDLMKIREKRYGYVQNICSCIFDTFKEKVRLEI